MIIDFSKDIDFNSLFPKTEFERKAVYFLSEFSSNSKTVSVQTSGSTGTPKVFQIEKEKMLSSAKMTCDFFGLKKRNSALLCLPVEYISGKMMVVRAIERKLKLTVKTPSSKPLEDLNEEIDFCAMTPLQVENSLDKIHLIKNLIIGGASVSESLKKKISQTLKPSNSQTKIFETYGMSETLSHIALKEIFPKSEECFKILNEIEISLDERECLKISAPKINTEILQTNDIAELKNDKQFKFLGRFDNVINSGGLKIFPEELETLVKKEISNEIVFLGLNDEKFGQKLILVIENEENETINHQLSLINYPSKNHKPKEIIFVNKIPRTENGKVNRLELTSIIQHLSSNKK